MKKMTALLLTIFFALSVMGCATTQDRNQSYDEQHPHYDKLPPRNTSNP